MNRTIVIAAFLVVLVSAFVVAGQVDERFGPFAELAGSCWEGPFPNGVTDRHCWEWALDGKFLRDVHELRGSKEPYGGETFYGWDEPSGGLRFWYFNTAGGRSEGEVERPGVDGRWRLIEHYTGATPESSDQQQIEMRNFVTFEADAYRVVTEQKDGASWKEVMSIRFARVAD